MNSMAEDDQSSVHSFASIYDDDQNSKEADDYKFTESDTDESCKLLVHLLSKEPSPKENVDEPSHTKLNVQKQSSVMEVTKVIYMNSFIRVYTDTISPRNTVQCPLFLPRITCGTGSQNHRTGILRAIEKGSRPVQNQNMGC